MSRRESEPSRRLVAIVDDDQGIRTALGRLVRTIGFSPITFASAEALLYEIDDLHPACVLTDIQMPGMDGLDLTRELHRRRPELPVMVMTAYPGRTDREAALAAGADEYMTKPFQDDELEDWLMTKTAVTGGLN